MRKIVTIGFAAGLLAAALPAQAANSNSNANANRSDAPAREQPQSSGGNAGERQICVVEPRSETRIRRPVCHTAREWRNLEGEVPNEQLSLFAPSPHMLDGAPARPRPRGEAAGRDRPILFPPGQGVNRR